MGTSSGKNPPGNRPPKPTDATYMETDEEIRAALMACRAAAAGKAGRTAQAEEPVLLEVVADNEPEVERPVLRPPMALLCILDDGKTEGEWVRLRNDRCVIGRTDGDVLIPHDAQISERHAEITRLKGPTGYRWLLADLQSSAGTFIRISGTALKPNNELLIGRGRYRFEAPRPGAAVAHLVELTPAGPGRRTALTLPEYWIGRDARACRIVHADDPLTNDRHARLYRDAGGQWHITNNQSLNGLWLRVELMPLDVTCQFRLGEQRFLFRVL